MKGFIKTAWLPVVVLVAVTPTIFGFKLPGSTPQPITVWDAALYDSEDCGSGPTVEVACPDYTMRIQGKEFTSHIQSECNSQLAASGIRKCIIPVDMKYFHDEWGFRDPSLQHHKSMWVDYECHPGVPGSKRVRAFGNEGAAISPVNHIEMTCD